METSHPVASIIVPMHNAEDYICDSLSSILRERKTPLEVIVVDDQSTDDSLERVGKLRDERIRVLDGPGRGISAAMNAGLAAARGSIIMRCDADDLYPEARIARQARWLEANPDYDGVCGAFSTIDHHGKLIADFSWTHFCTYAVRSSLVAKVGGFREYFETSEDVDFQLRLGEAGRIAFVSERWYFYRIHPTSITHNKPTTIRTFFERAAHELATQRQTTGSDDLQRGCPPAKPATDQYFIRTADEHIQELLLGKAWGEHQSGERVSALRIGARALAAKPLSIKAWKSVFALMLRPSRDIPSL